MLATVLTSRRWVRALATVLMVLNAGSSLAVFEILEGAAEVEQLSLSSRATQILYTRECDQCPMLALSVNAQTAFFDGRRPITLATATDINRGATVFFDKGERTVLRIVFWQ